jgi:hypothetical protein
VDLRLVQNPRYNNEQQGNQKGFQALKHAESLCESVGRTKNADGIRQWKDHPSWKGGVSAAKPRTGWWVKIPKTTQTFSATKML